MVSKQLTSAHEHSVDLFTPPLEAAWMLPQSEAEGNWKAAAMGVGKSMSKTWRRIGELRGTQKRTMHTLGR